MGNFFIIFLDVQNVESNLTGFKNRSGLVPILFHAHSGTAMIIDYPSFNDF